MKLCCKTCKCDVCGNVHECEIICNRISELDVSDSHKCNPIIDCSQFTLRKDYMKYSEWKCDVKKLVKRGDLA